MSSVPRPTEFELAACADYLEEARMPASVVAHLRPAGGGAVAFFHPPEHCGICFNAITWNVLDGEHAVATSGCGHVYGQRFRVTDFVVKVHALPEMANLEELTAEGVTGGSPEVQRQRAWVQVRLPTQLNPSAADIVFGVANETLAETYERLYQESLVRAGRAPAPASSGDPPVPPGS